MSAVAKSVRAAAMLIALVTVVGSVSASFAQPYRIYGAERFFTLDWESGQQRGRPLVSGYITNNHGLGAFDVRLLVESLDPSGGVVATTIGYVPFEVPSGSRVYFEVPLRMPAAAYRMTVLSYQWRFGPSGMRHRGLEQTLHAALSG